MCTVRLPYTVYFKIHTLCFSLVFSELICTKVTIIGKETPFANIQQNIKISGKQKKKKNKIVISYFKHSSLLCYIAEVNSCTFRPLIGLPQASRVH